jgi:hypothetical protein
MRALEKQLVQLRSLCSGEHQHGECGILHELVSAAHGEACACHPVADNTRRFVAQTVLAQRSVQRSLRRALFGR